MIMKIHKRAGAILASLALTLSLGASVITMAPVSLGCAP